MNVSSGPHPEASRQAVSIKDLYSEAISRLKYAGVADFRYDARELLKASFELDTEKFLLSLDENIKIIKDWDKKEAIFKTYLFRRENREPLQHILGYCWFMGLKFDVTKDTLIPRPETETLCETVLKNEKDQAIALLDLGTGSGCIAISLKKMASYSLVAASDISEQALKVAKKNARANHVTIEFIQSDLFNNIDTSFDVIVSNPPYIASASIARLEPEVRDHDPRISLDGGEDGLWYYRRILWALRGKILKLNGRLYMEIASDEAKAVHKMMQESGFDDIIVLKDLAGLDRVIYGRKNTGN